MLPAQSGGRGRQRQSLVTVTIQSNVKGADVTVDGSSVGNTDLNLQLPTGSHTFRVTADGYRDWQQTIDIRSDRTITANLEQITNDLTVTANVPAQVFIDGRDSGRTRFRRSLPPGTYSITLRAEGYLDFTTTVTLDRARSIEAELRPANAGVRLEIPQSMLDRTNPGAASMVTVFVDGRPQVQNRFDLPPGPHTILVRTGGMAAEITQEFEAGRTYVIVPNFSASIRTE